MIAAWCGSPIDGEKIRPTAFIDIAFSPLGDLYPVVHAKPEGSDAFLQFTDG
jgi:hypothetical protein